MPAMFLLPAGQVAGTFASARAVALADRADHPAGIAGREHVGRDGEGRQVARARGGRAVAAARAPGAGLFLRTHDLYPAGRQDPPHPAGRRRDRDARYPC